MKYLPLLLLIVLQTMPICSAQTSQDSAPVTHDGNTQTAPASPSAPIQQPPGSPETKQAGSEDASNKNNKPMTVTALPEINVKRDAFDCIYVALNILLVLVGIATLAAIWYQAVETDKLSNSNDYSAENTAAIREGSRFLVAFGYVKYRDVFKSQHYTRFCFLYNFVAGDRINSHSFERYFDAPPAYTQSD